MSDLFNLNSGRTNLTKGSLFSQTISVANDLSIGTLTQTTSATLNIPSESIVYLVIISVEPIFPTSNDTANNPRLEIYINERLIYQISLNPRSQFIQFWRITESIPTNDLLDIVTDNKLRIVLKADSVGGGDLYRVRRTATVLMKEI